jgi:hypothetical protein
MIKEILNYICELLNIDALTVPETIINDIKDKYHNYKVKKLKAYYMPKLQALVDKYGLEWETRDLWQRLGEFDSICYKGHPIIWINRVYFLDGCGFLNYVYSFEISRKFGYDNKYEMYYKNKNTNKYLSMNKLEEIVEIFFRNMKACQIEIKKRELETDFCN